jgi:hypothetical protein
MNEKQLIALARRNAAKSQAQAKPKRSFDATLDATRAATTEAGGDAERMFKEMKRREF